MEKTIVTRQEALKLGLSRYFTGKSCKYGHISERYLCSNQCLDCSKQYGAEWFKNNPDKRKSYSRANLKKRDPIAHKEYLKLWKQRNREKVLSDKKEWGQNNKDHIREYAAVYRARRPEVKRVSQAKRRSIKLSIPGSHTKEDVNRLFKLQSGKCTSCKCKLDKYHIDHIMPLSKGGTNDVSNIQLLCPTCNVRKSNKLPEQWARENGRLI